jgi:hypothetical protein
LELKWINSAKKQKQKEVTGGDRTLAWSAPARLVMLCSEGVAIGLQPDTGV